MRLDADDNLLIPMYYDGIIVNLQAVTPSGEKRFLPHGRVSGCSYAITSITDRASTILLGEGYATAATRFEATGLPTVMAFPAHNLLAVAGRCGSPFLMRASLYAATMITTSRATRD